MYEKPLNLFRLLVLADVDNDGRVSLEEQTAFLLTSDDDRKKHLRDKFESMQVQMALGATKELAERFQVLRYELQAAEDKILPLKEELDALQEEEEKDTDAIAAAQKGKHTHNKHFLCKIFFCRCMFFMCYVFIVLAYDEAKSDVKVSAKAVKESRGELLVPYEPVTKDIIGKFIDAYKKDILDFACFKEKQFLTFEVQKIHLHRKN